MQTKQQRVSVIVGKNRGIPRAAARKSPILSSTGEDTTVEEIAQLMTTHVFKRLPVMNGEKIVGIVSRDDIVSAIALGTHMALRTPIYDL